jgi:hypothetical protein
MEFRVKRIVPPGGMYFFEVAETSTMFRHPSMTGLLEVVERNLRENKLPVPENLRAIIEDFICRNVPPGFCFGDPEGKPVARTITLGDIRKGTQDMVLNGGGRVDQGKARQRLDICLNNCPNNDRRMCPSCVGLISWAQKLVGTSCQRDAYAGVCSVDATAIPAKIHVKNVAANEAYPPTCWVAKGE